MWLSTWQRGLAALRRGWYVILLSLALAGCGRLSLGLGPGAGGHSVPLKVLQSPQGATIALVPVYIGDQGPFPFALDTGATQSTIDRELVNTLQLSVVGNAPGDVQGVACSTPAQLVKVDQWAIGDVTLPGTTLLTVDIPPENKTNQGLQGLVGSDILSRYGAVTVDYQQQTLVLR